MPTVIGRDELRKLTGDGAQLVEVLPAEDYEWAHLPGAVSLPLKELDGRAGQLDRSRPVIVYCHDSLCDMSPRAAWRLEAAGFGPVHDYAAGKTDWIAADLPFEGTARLAGLFTRRGVATVAETTRPVRPCACWRPRGSGRSWSSTRPGWSWAPPNATPWRPLPRRPKQGR